MSLGADPTISAPDPNKVGSSFEALLNQLYGSAPGQYQAQATYQPQYTSLGLDNLNTELSGSGSTPGLDTLFSGSAAPAVSNAGTSTAVGDLNDLMGLGPIAAQGINNVNPGQANLLNNLTSTANGQLSLGTTLDPGSVDQTLNSVNQNFASRGMAGSGDNELSDALQLYAGGQNLLGTRESEAGSVASLDNSLVTAPATALSQPNSAATNQALSLTGAGQNISASAGPTLYNTNDLESLMNTVYNQSAASNIAQGNDTAAITSSIIGGVAGMGGSM